MNINSWSKFIWFHFVFWLHPSLINSVSCSAVPISWKEITLMYRLLKYLLSAWLLIYVCVNVCVCACIQMHVLYLPGSAEASNRTCVCVWMCVLKCPFCMCVNTYPVCISVANYCPYCVCVCVCVCVCAWCQANMWFTLVLFDVSITGLPPPTSTLLFDLHQSGPDHSCLCLLSKTLFISLCFSNPRSPTLAVTLARRVFVCVCVCACRFECLLFSEQMCVGIKCRKVKGVLHLRGCPLLWVLFRLSGMCFSVTFKWKTKLLPWTFFREVLIRDYDFDFEGKHLLEFESNCRYRLLNQVSAVQKRASLPLPVIQSIDDR